MTDDPPDPRTYTTGDDRYARFGEDFLDTRLAATQKRILRAVATNQRVLVVSGNGVGKSYAVAILILAFLYTNPYSTVLGTSGSYSQFVDTMWRPLKHVWKQAKERHGLPGRALDANPQIEIDDDWFAKVVSARDPGDLEGRHAEHILVVVEEADKEYITQEHFDSAGSSLTDENDRMIAIANPPEDETNVVYEKMQSPRWQVIQFSSFESHNVAVDLDEADEPIPGLTTLDTIEQDWEAWNRESWPGLDEARTAHERRQDLDTRWYRRRAGVIPPANASEWRPFGVAAVETAYEPRLDEEFPGRVLGLGYDVARMGGDWNALVARRPNTLEVVDRWQGVDHEANYRLVFEHANPQRDAMLAVDAQGEGSGVADRLTQRFPDRAERYQANQEAVDGQKFYDRWAEGLYHLGQFLKEGGRFANGDLQKELLAAARTITFEEKHYARRDATVAKATSKEAVKERLGRSPDLLDAAIMAVWCSAPDVRNAGIQQLTW